MATDRFGETELLTGVDPDAVRFCWRHRVAFDPDSTIYRDAGRCCPVGGEKLIGYLARFRDDQGLPVDDGPDVWDDAC